MKKLFRLGIFSVIAALIVGFLFYQWAISSVNKKDKTEIIFVIPQGQAAKVIGKRLKQANLIKNQLVFELLIDRKNYANKLQAGDFRLSPSMNLDKIIETLAHGTLDFWITFPEGLRVEEYAEKIAAKSNIDVQSFILTAKPYEGRLFPDTYLIPQNASAEEVTNILVDNFNQKSPTKDKHLIIIASLIERETKHQQDRSLVSSILNNRLDIGMALQIDATVQYVFGKPGQWWPKDLTIEQLKTFSPYNTYQISSLPPGPIANPGLAALKAAINPANTNYLYYVSDSGGFNHYAEDLEGHQQNIAKYLK